MKNLLFVALFLSGSALADMRVKEVCSSVPFPKDGNCYSGSTCFVGVRGDWLDLTNGVTVRNAPPSASVSIESKGTETTPFGCVPDGQGREGYVLVKLTSLSGTGAMTLRLARPGDSEDVSFQVKDGSFIKKTTLSAHRGEAKVLPLEGNNLDKLELVDPVEGDVIVSKSRNSAQVRLTFTGSTNTSLETKLRFSEGDPVLNRTNGWPIVTIYAPTPTLPNLIAQRGRNPLFRSTQTQYGFRLDKFFCSGLQPNAGGPSGVPPLDIIVRNTTAVAITRPFNVVLKSGTTTLLTQQIASLGANATQTLNLTWPGRQGAISVRNVTLDKSTGPSVIVDMNRFGCFLETPNATFDPSPLTVIVDDGDAIDETNDTDNTLTVQ